MFDVNFSTNAKKFLKKKDKSVALKILEEIETLRIEPFPKNVKRIVNRKEKIFRVRVGNYRIQYSVFYDKNILFVSEIEKSSGAY